MKKSKSIIGSYLSFKVRDWKDPIKGFLVDYNDEWILILNNPQDYIIDGYILLRFNYYARIDNRNLLKDALTEKILTLKGFPIKTLPIPIDDLKTILSSISKKYGVFAFHRKPQYKFRVGKLKSLDKKQLVIDALDPDAEWIGTNQFRPSDIRTIEFDTDYLNSLMIVAKKKMPK
jgi:hypothetical protein